MPGTDLTEELKMRRKSPKSAKRNAELASSWSSEAVSGVTPGGLADVLSLSDSLSSRSNFIAKLRTRFKKRFWRFRMEGGRVMKRWMDVCGSLAALIILMPLFVVVAVWLKLDSPGPLIYRQIRVGLNGRQFFFYKFRSMYVDSDVRRAALEKENESRDGVIFKMKNDPGITKCGRFIRKYSIDETPQFINVLLGDMSLVGPRPPLPSEVAQYSLDDRKRLEILPGITGVWQILGRSDIPFREQVVLDKEYIRGQGFWKDVLILFKTIPAVLAGKGAY